MTDWIARKDREPEEEGYYLIAYDMIETPPCRVAFWDKKAMGGAFRTTPFGNRLCKPIWWMPLPKPPEEK